MHCNFLLSLYLTEELFLGIRKSCHLQTWTHQERWSCWPWSLFHCSMHGPSKNWNVFWSNVWLLEFSIFSDCCHWSENHFVWCPSSRDLDQRQRYCCRWCRGLLPNQLPNVCSHQRQWLCQEHKASCLHYFENYPWNENVGWNSFRPWTHCFGHVGTIGHCYWSMGC